jgi:pimeloyl-ACP methyl ester carboxylesterase
MHVPALGERRQPVRLNRTAVCLSALQKGVALPTVAGVNGDPLHFEVTGDGPWLMLGYPFGGPGLEAVDSLPQSFLDRLTDRFRVIVVDYPRGVGRSAPAAPDVTTADNVCDEMLLVATAAGADRFAYWGYSWGGVVGIQLACRTDRLTALVIGGWPPLGAPYEDMRVMTAQASADPALPPEQRDLVASWATFYRSMAGWDADSIRKIVCPRMAYAGGDDLVIQAGVTVSIAKLFEERNTELRDRNWEIEVIPGLDHAGAMTDAAAVVPRVRPFLEANLFARS